MDINLPGQHEPNAGVALRNETGATILYGGVAVIDEAQAEAENASIILGQEGLTAVSTALMKTARLAVCLEKAGVPDHGVGRFCIQDGSIVQVLVNNSAVLKGSSLKGINASASLALATDGTDRVIAKSLEANGSAAALVYCRWHGTAGLTAIA
jgi:hypothetical protein